VRGEPRGNFLFRLPARLIPVEHGGDEPQARAVPGQERDLLIGDQPSHERHGPYPLAVEADRAEVPFCDDQVPALPDPVEVEELELLSEPGWELVPALPCKKGLHGPDPAVGVGDELPVRVVDRDADAARHDALLAEPQAEALDAPGRDAPFGEVRVAGIELQLEA
jgi:hypothetical protein